MSFTEKFAAIRAKPVIYCDDIQKPGYSAQVFCDRCGLSGLKVYVSSVFTPTIDLCPTCFNALGKIEDAVGSSQVDEDDDGDNVVGTPQNIQQHTPCMASRPLSTK
jgi:hypothetical protein